MVTQERKRLTVVEAEKILRESASMQEALNKLHSLKPGRQKAPPPPEGGIGVREAAKKYGVHYSTLSRWASRGWIDVKLRTKNWLYINENSLINFLNRRDGIGRTSNS